LSTDEENRIAKDALRHLTARSEIFVKGRNDSQADLQETSNAMNSGKKEIVITAMEPPWCIIYLPPGRYSELISFDPQEHKPKRPIPKPEVLPGEPNPNRPQPPTKRVRKPRQTKPRKVSIRK
jgi:hypothetical protein